MNKNPQQSWKEYVIACRKKCEKILAISKDIRYAGIINEYGRTITGLIKPGVKLLGTAGQARKEFFLISTLMMFRKSSTRPVGKLDYILVKHDKITIITFQRKNLTYYVTVVPKVKTIEKIVSKIKKIL